MVRKQIGVPEQKDPPHNLLGGILVEGETDWVMDNIAAFTPIGPVHSYSNEDHWTDQPTVPGVVLIGDAAGHVDPITGQGLSIGLRDVRQVSEILAGEDWRVADRTPGDGGCGSGGSIRPAS